MNVQPEINSRIASRLFSRIRKNKAPKENRPLTEEAIITAILPIINGGN